MSQGRGRRHILARKCLVKCRCTDGQVRGTASGTLLRNLEG
jgi:hypothetical protein